MRSSRPSSNPGKPLEGFLVVDKPIGVSSYDVIRAVKKRLSPGKIGHTGTLDPLASGVLPVVINGATRVIPFLDERVKGYEGTLRLGVVTDSDDSTGRVLRVIPLNRAVLTRDRIRGVFEGFVGKIRQVPPMFSAAKYHGKPLYKFARRGIEVKRREREVEILSLEIGEIDLPLVDFRVFCSKGTYVRALSRQIGEALGVGAHICRLRRTRSGPFTLDHSINLEEFERLVEAGELERRMITVRDALRGMPEIEVGHDLGRRIRNGGQVFPRDLEGLNVPLLEKNQRIRIAHEGQIVAIAEARIPSSDPGGQVPEGPALSLLRVFA
ncbi:MAG: tRNA pseudouridine(55) synthase TruB [Proteobacteria bacterium]|nr:tRNA pseudouridine(55) synthase TruB [Pseudomonadota bacterium]NIS71835.1 tRNA pseudouridine(55) synthase TruB [Pseudomonadota bacterium]